MLWNCSVGEDFWESLGCKEIQPVQSKGNQSWIFIGRTDAKAETPILWPLDGKNWLMEKTMMLEKIKGRRRRGQQRMRCLDSITDKMDMSLSKLRKLLMDSKAWHAPVHGVSKIHSWLSDWTEQLSFECLTIFHTGLKTFYNLYSFPILTLKNFYIHFIKG